MSTTPRQINIFRALGKDVPVYAHLPTVLNEQGEKLSKRNAAQGCDSTPLKATCPTRW
jgi:glutamyl-tRNA synthetase